MRGQELFFGKRNARPATRHRTTPTTSCTISKTERFFKPQMINGLMAAVDGPIKTFPLRGIKDIAAVLHDGRLLTLEDTVEFFNLILELNLNPAEKKDLLAFMRVL